MENYFTSFQAIEQVIKTYPNTGRMSDLVEIELRIAKKMLMSNASTTVFEEDTNARQTNIRRALQVVDQVLEHDPWGPVAAEANMVKGEAHLYMGQIDAARGSFERVQNDFPRSPFVERARLGVLRCDSLIGQASPRELKEQLDVVREVESERRKDGGAGPVDEFDDLDQSINQLADIEAGKMMEQASQYKRMGTHQSVKAADFLYREIIRRYPHSAQAEEARGLVNGLKIPQEQGRVAKAIGNINWNPFNWHKEPEPPWITPQLSPEDAVRVDSGIGPIAGVPETDFPVMAGSAGVRPAAFDDPNLAGGYSGDLASLPAFDASGQPARRPEVAIDGVPARQAGYAEPVSGPSGQAYPTMPGHQPPARPNPLPSIPDSDLVGTPSPRTAETRPYAPPPQYGGYQTRAGTAAPLPDMAPGGRANSEPPRLGVLPFADDADLVGPSRRLDPAPPPQPYILDPAPAGQSYYQDPGFSQTPGGRTDYQDPYAAPRTTYAAPAAQGGGWTLDSELR
jgi:outer membrane protein assembly factor BamD (BamD/ComL family)